MRPPKLGKQDLVSGSSKVVLRHEDISRQILSSEKYDIYTTDGLASLESDLKTVTASMGEFKKPPTKGEKVTLENVSENIE